MYVFTYGKQFIVTVKLWNPRLYCCPVVYNMKVDLTTGHAPCWLVWNLPNECAIYYLIECLSHTWVNWYFVCSDYFINKYLFIYLHHINPRCLFWCSVVSGFTGQICSSQCQLNCSWKHSSILHLQYKGCLLTQTHHCAVIVGGGQSIKVELP